MKFWNVDKTGEFKPSNSTYKDWLDFWRSKLEGVADTSDVVECAIPSDTCTAKTAKGRCDLVGAHVAVADDNFWASLEVILKCEKYNQKDKPKLLDVEGYKILLRNDVSKLNRRYFEEGDRKRPVFIAPICRSCNSSSLPEFELAKGTILVPLYQFDDVKK